MGKKLTGLLWHVFIVSSQALEVSSWEPSYMQDYHLYSNQLLESTNMEGRY